jgi:NAD(P)-dependent dehydrogenase (short-subunit alcohol dehydrogenase family)
VVALASLFYILQDQQANISFFSNLNLTFISKMSLKDQVVLITGGAKNLGAQVALELAPLGVQLALHYNTPKTKEAALELEAQLKQDFPSIKVIFYAADLTTAAAVDKLFAVVIKDFGKINIVVNTIGMVLKKPITEISEDEYDALFA